MLSLDELKTEVSLSLNALKITRWDEFIVGQNVSYQFIIEQFGVIVCIINPDDRAFVEGRIQENFKDWRLVFVSTSDNVIEIKDKLLWALMQSGYFRWLRYTYESDYMHALKTSSLSQKIINKRLEIWKNKPKYKFLIEDNLDALKQPISRLLAAEVGFFDDIPEEE